MCDELQESAFDRLMVDAFPDGVPEPEAVVVGDDHTAYHLLEALIQAYDMLGAYEELNEVVEAEVTGWCVLQEHEGGFYEALMATWAPSWAIQPEERLTRYDRVLQWIREAGASAAKHLAIWLHGRRMPRVFLWVATEGHGMVPFIIEARDPDAGGPMVTGSATYHEGPSDN